MVVVDVQNDFISGSLAIINCPAAQNGEDVSEGISLNIQCIFWQLNVLYADQVGEQIVWEYFKTIRLTETLLGQEPV